MSDKKFFENICRLKTQEKVLIKSCISSLNALSLLSPYFVKDINKIENEITLKRKQEIETIHQNINEILDNIFEVQHNKLSNSNNNFDATALKESLISIQKKILQIHEQVLKEKTKLEEEQKILEFEVSNAQRKLEENAQSSKTNKLKNINTGSKVKKNVHKTQYIKDQDIHNFDTFIELHGRTGGWEESDHLTFVRLRKQYRRRKTLENFVSAVHILLPDISRDKINEHDKWCEEFDNLEIKYKDAIQKWKKMKQRESNNRSQNENKSVIMHRYESDELKKKKELVAEWKKKCEEERLAKELEIRLKQTKEEERIKKEKQKQNERKMAVQEYRQRRKEEQERTKELRKLKLEEEKREKAAKAKELLRTFRKLDELHVEKQRILRESAAHIEPLLPKVNTTVHVDRDPERLLQQTKVWKSHCTTNISSMRPILHLKNIPHLAVPDWRKGVF